MKPSLMIGALRILVVDDCPDSVDSLRMLCTLLGHQVRTSTDGEAALVVAADFQPHVVLLDIGMPKVDGLQVARRLREMPGMQRTFLLAITGYAREADRARSLQFGFDLHLSKPVDPAILEDFFSKVLVGAGSCEGRIV